MAKNAVGNSICKNSCMVGAVQKGSPPLVTLRSTPLFISFKGIRYKVGCNYHSCNYFCSHLEQVGEKRKLAFHELYSFIY